jgi:prolyl 4-hydroxylase
MTADFGPTLRETFYAYVPPSENATSRSPSAGRRAEKKAAVRLYVKFSNLSPNELYVWRVSESDKRTFASRIEPFGSFGAAAFLGQKFVATLSAAETSGVVEQWQVGEASGSNYRYDPYGGTQAARKALGDNSPSLALYQMQLKNLVFATQYRAFTGNEWLALYGQRMPPRYHMWRADEAGQTHSVETREIHFVEDPDASELERGMSAYGPRPDQVGRMRRYRDTHPTLNLDITVVSGSPRVFEIRKFLSPVEASHLLALVRNGGGSSDPGQSTTSDDATTRQAWIERHRDFMVDAIYKRAADVLQMNEALLRIRRKSEIPEFVDSDIGVAERLQVVNYQEGQESQPQYDFSVPDLVRLQPSRFATMILYLNDDMEGGETTFPRSLNAESDEPLKVTRRGVLARSLARSLPLFSSQSPSDTIQIKPELGKAILFYNMLPDGNYDERSLHASAPVLKGEKVRTGRGGARWRACAPCQRRSQPRLLLRSASGKPTCGSGIPSWTTEWQSTISRMFRYR